MLMLIIVLGAVLGLAVLWFTLLRHERTLRARGRRRARFDAASVTEPRLTGMAMVGIGSAADEPVAVAAGHAAGVAAVAGPITQTLVAEDDAREEPGMNEEPGADELAAEGAALPEEAPADQPPNPDHAADTAGTADPADVPDIPSAADAADVPDVPSAADEDDAPKLTGANAQRKLTDEILSRVESELAERDAPRWKDMAALVRDEFGVTVHPSSIQKAVKRRRRAQTTQTA